MALYAVALAATMWWTGDVKVAGRVAFVALTVTMWLFIVIYGVMARPLSNREGRALLGFKIAAALVCTQSTLSLIVPAYPWRHELRMVLLYFAAVAMLWLTWVLGQNLRESRHESKGNR